MRKPLLGFLLLLLFASAFGLCLAADDYRVILKDGSWLRAREEPATEGSTVRVRLFSGQVTVLPSSRIDWPATQKWNRDVSQGPAAGTTLPGPKREVSGTVTMVRDEASSGKTATSSEIEAEDGAAAEALRNRSFAIENEIRRLRVQQRDLEKRASEVADRIEAEDLRKQADDIEQHVQDLRAEQNGLMRQLDAQRSAEQPPAGDEETPTEDPDQRTRERIRALQAQLSDLRTQKNDLEKRAGASLNLDEAQRLRQQAADVQKQMDRLRAEQNGLILQLSGRSG